MSGFWSGRVGTARENPPAWFRRWARVLTKSFCERKERGSWVHGLFWASWPPASSWLCGRFEKAFGKGAAQAVAPAVRAAVTAIQRDRTSSAQKSFKPCEPLISSPCYKVTLMKKGGRQAAFFLLKSPHI